MFNLALVRSGLGAAYSEGYNPRMKLSVAVARSVGLSGDNEILDVRLSEVVGKSDKERVKEKLLEQLPADVIIKEVMLLPVRPCGEVRGAEYELPLWLFVPMEREEVEERIEEVLGSESLFVERTIDSKGAKRTIDVRDYIVSMEIINDSVLVKTAMTGKGTIRVDEICSLLGLTSADRGVWVTRREVYCGQ